MFELCECILTIASAVNTLGSDGWVNPVTLIMSSVPSNSIFDAVPYEVLVISITQLLERSFRLLVLPLVPFTNGVSWDFSSIWTSDTSIKELTPGTPLLYHTVKPTCPDGELAVPELPNVPLQVIRSLVVVDLYTLSLAAE